MKQRGRPTVATRAQRARVERLAAEGASVRQIAAAVFGAARYRGRVERILRPRADPAPAPGAYRDPKGEVDLSAVLPASDAAPLLRELFNMYMQRVASGEIEPSVAELARLADLERRLEAKEQLERLNALTRELS